MVLVWLSMMAWRSVWPFEIAELMNVVVILETSGIVNYAVCMVGGW